MVYRRHPGPTHFDYSDCSELFNLESRGASEALSASDADRLAALRMACDATVERMSQVGVGSGAG